MLAVHLVRNGKVTGVKTLTVVNPCALRTALRAATRSFGRAIADSHFYSRLKNCHNLTPDVTYLVTIEK